MAPQTGTVWYVAYGSNMSSTKFTGSRGIVPIATTRVRIPGFELAMETPGVPYSEPSFASITPRKRADLEKGIYQPDVIGVAYLLQAQQYERVIASEGGGIAYKDIEVQCEPLGADDRCKLGERVQMRTLGTILMRRPAPTPSERYMSILTDGAQEAKLPRSYQRSFGMAEPDLCRNGLSQRGWVNVEAIMPKIRGAVEERKLKQSKNIDLATAENWLIRPELLDLCKTSIVELLELKNFSYPRGFSGDPDLLDALAAFFNKYFSPLTQVLPDHLATAPGANACIDTLLYNICEPGDGILMPGPYWNGFDFGIRVRSAVNPVLVGLDSFGDNFTEQLFPALEKAYQTATCKVKALMITNPHNPLSVCYPKNVLEHCLRFCTSHNIHFISDEVYALSRFESPDLAEPEPFVSVLSLNLDDLGVDKSRVHMVWSTSKDFGQSGIRMGCTVTQSNPEMAVGLALAANTQISALTTTFVTSLLKSPELPSLISLNSRRLASAYAQITSFLNNALIWQIALNNPLQWLRIFQNSDEFTSLELNT
ncbi:hypothetical protein DHEL01_v206174 [Diaporthe helianthi]|uniref:Aminotransferase class I/classII large domain-containing protein n=1 Tax=Diaporthe helianthi TaxID=158607 RepID=A0A2P5HYW5_DIAHE|nr:hypothetical protein DHEL01_v206174 [Diaporthe helianthi]